MNRIRWWLALTAAVALVVGLASPAVFAPPAVAEVPAGGMAAAQVGAMFGAYGDAGGHWTGGDSTVSVLLPDGRVAWLFADTFLGAVNADGSRPADAPMVNNTIVVQDGTSLVDTLHGGTETMPQALVTPSQAGEFFWVAGAVVESGVLKVLYNRYRRYGSGGLDVELAGTSLGTFALPGLTLSSVVDLPVGKAITWGAALLVEGGYTYVYGASSGLGGLKFGHVARAAVGALGDAWQYWTGTGWSDSESAAARLLSGVGTAFGVQKVAGQYVLVTQETNAVFDPQIVAYTATFPTGPWSGPVQLLTAPEQQPGSKKIVYTARLHPELARSGKLLLSYDVNSLDNAEVLADVRLYRPRFVELDWPQPDPATLPAAPTGFSVTTDDAGVAHLSWQAVTGASGYRVWRRDVTGGQTHFMRQWQPVTGTSTNVNGLITGHRHEFKVTAANTVGEGPFSATVAATSRIVRDASIIRLANTPEAITGDYFVELKDTPAVRGASVKAFAEELLAQAGGTLTSLFPLTLNGFSATLTETQAIDLAGHPDVLAVEQDQTVTVDDGESVDVDGGGEQDNPPWGLDRIDQRALPLDYKYVYPDTGGAVRAYVLDSGININHETFTGRASLGANTIDPPPQDASDCNGHGTHVAGTLGGGLFGVAKGVEIVSVKVLKCLPGGFAAGTWESIRKGVEWAVADGMLPANATKPKIINMSLGGYVGALQTSVDKAVENAISSGFTVVIAAGNDDGDARYYSPAHVKEAITVGGTDDADYRGTGYLWPNARGSNYGDRLDLFAPGEEIESAVWSANRGATDMTGTSMAAPHVAGAAAMVLATHPKFTPDLVERVLVDASTKDVVQDAESGSPNRLLFIEQPPSVAPANLVATARPDGTIDLDWDEPPGGHEGHYLVSQRDATAGGAFTRWGRPVFGATSAVAEGLQEGHRYEFRVAASNSMGVGPESNVAGAVAHTQPPAAPTALTATAEADGRIRLDWTAPAGSGLWYWVYQRDVTLGEDGRESEPDFTRLPLPLTTCCRFRAGLLRHEHAYEFKVAAINRGGEGPASGVARATARYPIPAAPSALSVAAGDGRVSLAWTASATVGVFYEIQWRAVGTSEWNTNSIFGTCCEFMLSYLSNRTTYEFRIVAEKNEARSAPSNLVQATPYQPLPAQVGVTATPNADGTITVRWVEPASAANGPYGYALWRRDVTAGQAFGEPWPVACCAYVDGQGGWFDQNHVYEFKVAANNGRYGPESVPVRATAHFNPPGPPTGLAGRATGNGTVELDWAPPGAGGFFYWMYLRDVTANPSPTAPWQRWFAGESKSWVSPALISGHRYEFQVAAENKGGEGPPSTRVQVTSLGGLPAPPSGLTATAGNRQVTLQWTASPSPNAWYVIDWRPVGTSTWNSNDIYGTCCSFTLSYLGNGVTYEFKMRAINASGSSTSSNLATARPLPPPPTPPSGLTATGGDGGVALRWTASPGPELDGYYISYRRDGGAWQQLPLPTTCCVFDWHPIDNSVTYDFYVRAHNLGGYSVASGLASARPVTAAPTGLTATAGNARVTLRWTGNSPGAYYYISVSRGGGGWQELAWPDTTCCDFVYEPIDNGVTYAFRVRAHNHGAYSGWSNVASATPVAPEGSCSVVPFTPRPINASGWWETEAINSTTCVGPVYNVRVSVYLWVDIPWMPWEVENSNTESWGTVAFSRYGYAATYSTSFFPELCLPYITQATTRWTTYSGSPREATRYSDIDWHDGQGRPC